MSETLSFPPTSASWTSTGDSKAYVVDAWPVMEWFRGRQPAAVRFERLLVDCQDGGIVLLISRINVGEIFYITAKNYGRAQATSLVQQLSLMSLKIVSVTDRHVDTAAELKSRYPISYADAFAAGLAITTQAPLVTGDPEFRGLEKDGILTLDWIGA